MKKTGAGAYSNAFGRAYQRYPNHNSLPEELKSKIRESYFRLAKDGQVVYPRKAVIQADEKDFNNFFPLIDAQMGSLYAYSVAKKSDNTALYLVENTITKLKKF